LDALAVAITSRKVNHILDTDVRDFFGSVNHDWLIRFLEHRIGDKRIIRLWLKAGILEDGIVTVADSGTGQGSVISPLLGNIYLHYVFDLWAERWRRQEAQGDMIVVRYADDLVAGFEHEDDARRFLDAMRERFEAFSLSLHPDKTRLIEFGRHAAVDRKKRGVCRPETFAFLGFTANLDGEPSNFNGRPGATACGRSSRKSRRSCGNECTRLSQIRDTG
jgi:RNA-directed DNA polymerase